MDILFVIACFGFAGWCFSSLANDYINYYVGKDTKNDTPQNRKRALDYFTSIMQK